VRFPDPGRSRAVLIGTSGYRDGNLSDLPQVIPSISDLAAALTDPEYGVIRPGHCDVITDEGAVPLIGQTLREAAEQAEDLLLVYYAGHGLIGGERHDLYLGLPGSEWAGPEWNSLEYDKVRGAVRLSPATTKVIILDCCFSGRVVTGIMADPGSEIINKLDVFGSYVLTSAQRDQVALIIPGEKHTAFTGRLLTLLHEGIPDGPEFLTIEGLYQNLLIRMRSEGLPQPEKRATGAAELLPLTRNRAATVTSSASIQRRLEDAHAIGAAGDPAQAADRIRDLAPECERVLGAEHPTTLLARQYLAVNLGEAENRDQAVAILRVLLPDRRRILGNDHEHTLRTLHMLARNLGATGQTDEAIALLQELIAARYRVIGPSHPHTIRARHDLDALRGQGN
jgi:hypothetical protein